MITNLQPAKAKPLAYVLLLALLACVGGASSLHAQYEVKSGVYNRLSERVPEPNPNQIAPIGPDGAPSGEPTITPQYSNVVEASANAGPVGIDPEDADATVYPSSASVTLLNASVGTSFASGVPRYFYGDEITPPTAIVSAEGTRMTILDPASFWRAEPVRAGEILTNPSGALAVDYRSGEPAALGPLEEGTLATYYYSPHARRVFANTPGNVEVTWRSSLPDPDTNSYIFYKERFTVSSATSRPIRTIFWTEKSFNGPRVTIPSGRIVTVNPVYSNVFPETVETEYVVAGSSQADPNAEATVVLRTLWYEKANGIGELHAYNKVGRILVEYLGALRGDGTHEFLGADIVSVEQSAQAKTLTVMLGDEIRPSPDEDLIAIPVTSADSGEQVSYYGSNPRPDGSLAYYAERVNEIEDRVAFYWLETQDAAIPSVAGAPSGLAINWPKHLNKYLQFWPDDVTDFASYTVGIGGSSSDSGTGLKFEDGKIPQIVYQDASSGDEALIDTISQRLIVGLGDGGDQENRALLKFTGDNGGIWYVRLLTQADERDEFEEGDGGASLNATAYVGERIDPPSKNYSLAGYIAKGELYSPSAYIDPFAEGIPAAEKGAIIPVNALPEGGSSLTVWWFKKVEAPSSEFADFYTTAKVGHYSLAYRESLTVAAESFDDGAEGWSNATTSAISGTPGSFLGAYGKTDLPSTEKTFFMAGNDANNATVSFTFHRLDSWDNEIFQVFINGNRVINQAFGPEVVDTLSGTSDFGPISYEWTIIPVAGSYKNYFGGGWSDQAFDVRIIATAGNDPVASSMTIGFGSTLNSGIIDESFGIDDLVIEVPLPQQIVMASNLGTGSLASPIAAGTIYNQPDPTLPGYNPNEEHALMQGGRGYAMRDDLNLIDGTEIGQSFTSLPRVLLEYTDPEDDRPAMSVYEVLRESPTYRFSYPVTAGTILSAPMPMPLLPLALDGNGEAKNTEVFPEGGYTDVPSNPDAPDSYTPFTFKDRKGYVWVYRGPHGNPDTLDLPIVGPLVNTEFNTAGDPEIWSHTLNVDAIDVNNGVYSATGQGDAQISTGTITEFSGDEVPVIKVRFKASANQNLQLFWANEDGNFSGARSLSASYQNVGEWEVVEFPVATSGEWAGKTIHALRIDPVSGEVPFEIDWIRSHSVSPSLGMQFYYTMREGFVFPNRSPQPEVGTPLPYLRTLDGEGGYVGDDPVTATPLTVLYYPAWPENPPALAVGETLALPKRGLPAVRGQSSATVIYQQSIANEGRESVVLHDPTRAKTVLINDSSVRLTELPVSLKTTAQNGKTYFQLAQPHLQQRFYFDPTLGDIGGLVLIGEFVDEIAGEDYLNLNTLSAADTHALETLVDDADKDKAKWDAAIAALSTTMETFMENPASRGTYIVDSTKSVNVPSDQLPGVHDSDTAVDSYALTAPGKGSGYVTLLFADGEAFTPQGEPIAMQVIEVASELYQGDLKVISASNPLDEQTSLRHSGDFAASPENFDFEWAYALPVDGMAPPIYSTQMERVLGTSGSNTWYLLANPEALPPAAVPYGETPVALEAFLEINNASYNPSAGFPGLMLKSVDGLTFADSVPTQIIFSAELGPNDGFVVYVNDVPALAYHLPFGVGVPGNLSPEAPRAGLAGDGLSYQFELDRALFNTGFNDVTIALYSSQTPSGTASGVDFRVNVPVKSDLVTVSGSPWIQPNGELTNSVVIGGSAASPLGDPLLVFSDTYFTMRYKAKGSADLVTGQDYSEWNTPVLVESWVKRVLDGINPFNQRQTDLYNNPVSTDVSILTQAGSRWEGDVALNIDTIEDFGLIEIYETVLNRVKRQSLDAGITTDSVNSTLLLVAGYLNDLYMTLGNEAWDDARNPTLQVDTDTSMEDVETARYSFEGQMASLMDETLALLRGRDDFLSPGTTVAPSYNRLYWNYTNGINSGEPFYAVNYNITEQSGGPNADGVLDAADAQWMFPQGHGDAYGHYLTALKGYYKLLASPIYTWLPSTEGVSVLGQTVQVDYADERKFAAAAAALARTSVDVLDFTARRNHVHGDEHGWENKWDGKYNSATGLTRYWGTDEWSSRASQGTYYNWVSANAILPDVDTEHEGIQKIDRTTVPELDELVTSANQILALSAGEQAHLNPLGLAPEAMTFDISPSEMAAGKSHFEQIYERAVQAALNAKGAFQLAGKMNQMLREQNNNIDDYNAAVSRQEDAFEYQLITLFGTPYAGDIGPGKLYAQGYTGPDLYHSYFIDRPSELVDVTSDVTVNFREPVNKDPFTEWSVDNVYVRLTEPGEYVTRTYRMSPFTLGQFSDTVTGGLGSRAQTGEIQSALLDVYEAQVNLRDLSNTFSTLMRRFDRDYQLYSEFLTDFAAANEEAAQKLDEASAMTKASFALTTSAAGFALTGDYIRALASASAEALPTSVGFSNDATSVGRMAAILSGETAGYAQGLLGLAAETKAALLEAAAADLEDQAQEYIDDYNFDSVEKQHVVEFERLYDEVLATAFDITRKLTDLQRANERVSKLYGEANHILSERETFRQRAASVIQGYRTRDLVFRELRNEELEQYKALYDLAQTYAYATAKAYDYETGLLSSSEGDAFVDQIIQTYSIGSWDGANPIETGAGDSGLASILGGLRDDWAVAEGRLGINNPDQNGTVFSLRQELFRIRADQPTADDDLLWKQVLQQHIMSDVMNDPDVAMYANNIQKADGSAVPGIVISFATTIEPGLNFFGWPLAGGDHAYSQSSFATKIFSSGLIFSGYVGMDPYSEGMPGASGPASSDPNALAATPYAYLIPAGMDTMRIPPLGDTNQIHSWEVKDQALPLPKNIGGVEFSGTQFFTPQGTLNEQLWIARKHQAFRAVDDPVYFYSTMPAEFTNSRLIGRSVWNSQWKIVIPAYSLLNDEQEGLDRFVKSVSDIKLFFRTYSHSGN